MLFVSYFQSKKPNNCWLWKYEFGEKSKISRKNLKPPFFHDGFSTNLVHKTEFLNLGFCAIFINFWHSVGDHTIFQYFFVNSHLCSLRLFRLHSSEKDAAYKNTTKRKKASGHGFVCVLFKIENMIRRKCFN